MNAFRFRIGLFIGLANVAITGAITIFITICYYIDPWKNIPGLLVLTYIGLSLIVVMSGVIIFRGKNRGLGVVYFVSGLILLGAGIFLPQL